MTVLQAKEYLKRMELNRHEYEQGNLRAYADARELSALVSLAEHGNLVMVKQAIRAISSIQ